MSISPTTQDTGLIPPAESVTTQSKRAMWSMATGGLLLGTLGIFLEEAGQSPLTSVWFRCVFGALTLGVWGWATGRLHELRLRGRALFIALFAGCLMVANWLLFFEAILRTSIGVATLVFHIQPFWVLALGAWWLHERVSGVQIAAVFVALAGLALTSGVVPIRVSDAAEADYQLGLALCVAGSFCYALVTLIAKSSRQLSSFSLAWWQCAVGAAVLAWVPNAMAWPDAAAHWFWLVGLGVIHTGLAYVLLYRGMAGLSAARIAALQFVYPATAVLMDWLVYGRALTATQWAGVILMGTALLMGARQSAPR